MNRIFGLLAALIFSATTIGPAAAAMPGMSDGMMYHRTSYRGAPNLPLTLSLVIAGGGPAHFEAGTLVGTLGGPLTKAEVAKLNRQFGEENVAQFLKTFTFAIDDVLHIVTTQHIPLPAAPMPDPANGGKLTAALYAAGVMPNGRFDIGYMIEHLISHKLHVVLMHDINANPAYGPKVNASFHTILTQAMLDLKDAYGL